MNSAPPTAHNDGSASSGAGSLNVRSSDRSQNLVVAIRYEGICARNVVDTQCVVPGDERRVDIVTTESTRCQPVNRDGDVAECAPAEMLEECANRSGDDPASRRKAIQRKGSLPVAMATRSMEVRSP